MVTGFKLRNKVLALILSICLVITLIPDMGYAQDNEPGNGVSQEDNINPEDVTKEDVIEKDETTTTYSLGDGEKMTVFHGGQVRFEDEDGKLKDYDPSLIEIPADEESSFGSLDEYKYTNKEGDKKQYLPETLDEDTPVLLENGELKMSFTPTKDTLKSNGLENTQAKIEKEKVPTIYESEENKAVNAVYGDEEAKSIFKYTSCTSGVKETITLNKKPGSNIFTYYLTLDKGTIPKKNAMDEGITFYDENETEVIGYIEAPWMNDASGEAYSEDITFDIEETNEKGKFLLTMTVSEDYLSDEDRQFPVVIDPTYTWKGNDAVRDVYAISGSADKNLNFYGSGFKNMPVGVNERGVLRTYIHFINLYAKVKNQSISSAKFTIYEKGNGASGQKIGAYRITETWSSSSLKWTNRPTFATDPTATITTKRTAHTARTFDLQYFVQNIASGKRTNYGIVLKNITSSPSIAMFYGSRSTESAYRPKLVVTYYSKPTTATSVKASTYYAKSRDQVKVSFSGITSTGLSRYEYKLMKYSHESDSSTLCQNYESSRPIKSGNVFPTDKEGCYKIYVRGVNKAGVAGEGKSSSTIHIDRTKPVIGSVGLKDSSDGDIAGKCTRETNPLVTFSGVKDLHLNTSDCIKYAIVKAGTASPSSDKYKTPQSFTISSTSPYSGSFRLASTDRSLASGAYDIYVKVYDRAKNEATKKVSYIKDTLPPEGNISITKLGMDAAIGSLEGTISVQTTVDGTGSEAKSLLKIYKVDGSSLTHVETLFENHTGNELTEIDTVSLCRENGDYRLVLHIEDGVGNTKDVTKDIRVFNTIDAPLLKAWDTGSNTARVQWEFPQGLNIQRIEYRFEGSTEYTQLTTIGGLADSLSGTGNVILPLVDGQVAEGIHKIYVRGITDRGIVGLDGTSEIICDKTMPAVSIEGIGLQRGYLMGTVTDDNFESWAIYIKEASEDEFEETPYLTGAEQIEDISRVGFIDLMDSRFNRGETYTIKLTATDRAGNIGSDQFDITVPMDAAMESRIDAGIHIAFLDRQRLSEGHYVIGSDKERLSLAEEEENVLWYIGGEQQPDSNLKNLDGALKFDEDVFMDVLAVNTASNGERAYSVPVTTNVLETVTFDEGDGISLEKEITLDEAAVSLQLAQETEGINYYIKAGDGDYTLLDPDESIYVSDLMEDGAYSKNFTIKAVAAEGVSVTDDAAIFFDTIEPQQFKISDIETYAPNNLSADAKLNYKVYLTWDGKENLPDNIFYEVYRGDSAGFTPDENTLVTDNIKGRYFEEMNINYSKKFYYKVCAVKKDDEGNVIARSTLGAEKNCRVVDENEYAKYLGVKEYWEYADIDVPNGEGFVEKSRGNFIYRQKDAQIPNEGLEVHLMRVYNSMSSTKGSFGYGWNHDYDMQLMNICKNSDLDFLEVVLKDGDGSVYHFKREDEDSEFVSSLTSYVNLKAYKEEKKKNVRISGDGSSASREIVYKFVLSTKDGLSYYFDIGGSLALMEEANGNFVIFERESKKGRLCRMLTNNNTSIDFEYYDEDVDGDGVDPYLVKSITMPDGSKVKYEYTSSHENSDLTLLTAVTEYGAGDTDEEHGITYRYEYDDTVIIGGSLNMNLIKDATGQNVYRISYNNNTDRVTKVKYPDDEEVRFEYDDASGEFKNSLTAKYIEGRCVLAEKNYFSYDGRCKMSVSTAGDIGRLRMDNLEGLDVTTYTYVDGLLSKTTSIMEYSELDSNGYVVNKRTEKNQSVGYSGDSVVKETQEDGSVSEYTYYTSADGEHLDGLIKTSKETEADGNVVSDELYTYDEDGNVLVNVDYASKTKNVNTYVASGPFKGELETQREYIITSSGHTIQQEILQSKAVYTYEYRGQGMAMVKTEGCQQTIYDAGNEQSTTTVTTVYDVMGRELSETDSRGYKTENTYDGFGRKTSTRYIYGNSGSKVQTSNTSYDANGLVTYEKVEDGTEKYYTYDNMNRVIETRVKKGDIDKTIYTSYRYEDVYIYLGKGNETKLVENAYVTKESFEEGSLLGLDEEIIKETYIDSEGRVVRSYESGLYTDMTYNMQGDMVTKFTMGKSLTSDGLLELYVYDAEGNLTWTILDPGYDENGYFVKEDAEDEDGNITYGSILTGAEYDEAGKVKEEIDPLGNKIKYEYDSSGNLTSVTDALGARFEYQYDVLNSDGTTSDITLTPRALGENPQTSRSVVTTDSTDRVIRMEDFAVSGEDESSIYTTYEYDERDNLTKATEKEGNYKTYSYDVKDRITLISYYEKIDGNSVCTLKTAFTYDDSDNMKSMADYKVVEGVESLYRYTAYEYDSMNRLIGAAECKTTSVPTESVIEQNMISYGYDDRDNMVSITYPNDEMGVRGLEFEYDNFSYLLSVKAVTEGGSSKLLKEYTYDNFGRASIIKDYTDFLNGTSKWLERSYSYDKYGRTTGIEYRDNMSGSSSEVKEAHYYSYDKRSNIIKEESLNSYGLANGAALRVIKKYTYDDTGRLIQTDIQERSSGDQGSDEEEEEGDTETEDSDAQDLGEEWTDPPDSSITKDETISYAFDAAGNKISEITEENGDEIKEETSYTYNGFNQLKTSITKDSTGSVTSQKNYIYDHNGNQTKISDSLTDEEITYSYDADNRLKKAVSKTGGIIDYIQENSYNGFGQRVEKKEGNEETNYFYDGSSVLCTRDSLGEITSFNLIGSSDNVLATARKQEQDIKFYTYTKDLRESSINILDDNGASVISYEYDDYGETVALGSENFYNEICYAAGIYDSTTKLYYLNARYYSPETGNFLTQDTYRGDRSRTHTLNLYGYCAGNPISYTDPSGHWLWGVIGAVMGAYDGYMYAKKHKLTGWKKAAAIAGGAALGAVDPCKIIKVASKAVKLAKVARSGYKKVKTVIKATKKSKVVKVVKKKILKKTTVTKSKKNYKVVRKQLKKCTSEGHCFVAGTKIHTKDGFKAIENIKPGDYVWSENPETNEKALKKVKKIFVREKDSIIRLTINGEVIETTDEHPFYVEGQGFTRARDLNVGDEVRLEDGTTATVESNESVHLDKPIKVYNFEVEEFHTYYVSKQKVLVHNTCNTTKKKVETKKQSSGSKQSQNSKYTHSYSNKRTQYDNSKKSSFVSEMSPEEASRYEAYWCRNAPDFYTPNSKITHYKNNNGVVEKSTVIYDEFGRQKWRIDYNNHGFKNHSKPHLHERIYNSGYDPIKGKETRYDIWD